jgi:hypothetical protein
MALCRQLQELRVALGWKERFALESTYFVLDMGSHCIKSKIPAAFHFQYVGEQNVARRLPRLPVQYYTRATVYQAYTRDLHMRCLYFDMLDMQATASSFFTAPGGLEFLLGQPCPHMVSMCVSGEWTTDTISRSARRHAEPSTSHRRHHAEHKRRRYFHVCFHPLRACTCLEHGSSGSSVYHRWTAVHKSTLDFVRKLGQQLCLRAPSR